jgi:hypothetical protein
MLTATGMFCVPCYICRNNSLQLLSYYFSTSFSAQYRHFMVSLDELFSYVLTSDRAFSYQLFCHNRLYHSLLRPTKCATSLSKFTFKVKTMFDVQRLYIVCVQRVCIVCVQRLCIVCVQRLCIVCVQRLCFVCVQRLFIVCVQ